MKCMYPLDYCALLLSLRFGGAAFPVSVDEALDTRSPYVGAAFWVEGGHDCVTVGRFLVIVEADSFSSLR